MRRWRLAWGIPVVLPVLLSLFTACEEPTALSSDAKVLSVSIGTVQAQSIGEPSVNWTAVVPGDIYLSHSQLANARVLVNATSGAKIYYAKGAEGAQPYFVEDSTLSLEHNDLIWIETFSANLDSYLIYAVKVHNRTPRLSGITLNYQYPNQTYSINHSYGLNLGTPGQSLEDTALVAGEIWYGKTQENADLTVTATAEMTDSVVTIAADGVFPEDSEDTENPEDPEVIPPPPTTIKAVNNNFFYIRSTSGQEQGETLYYKIKLVQKNDDLSLTGNKVTINNVDATAGTMGSHSLVGQEDWGNYNDGAGLDPAGYVNINTTVDTANTPVTVTAKLTNSAGVTVEYSHTSNNLDYLMDDDNWSASADLGVLPNNEFVVMRLTSELGVRGWYKFRVRVGRTGYTLSGITINNSSVSTVPQANAQVTGASAGEYTMPQAGPWNQVSVSATLDSASGGAQIAYAVAAAANTNTPAASFTTDGSLSEVALGHYVVIRVVSENGGNTGYYKVRLVFGDTDASLKTVSIGGASIGTLPEANSVANGDIAVRYQMSGAGPWTSVVVAATATSNKAVVTYAPAATINTPIADASWSDSGTLSDIPSGQYVFIRVTSESGIASYYKVRLVYGSGEASLSSVTVGGATATVGTPGGFDMSMGGFYTGVAGAVTLTAEQAGDGSTVTVAATASTGATVRYNWGGGMDFGFGFPFYYISGDANWNTTGQDLFKGGMAGGFISVPAGVNGAFIVIEVTSEDGTTVNTYAVSCAVGD